MASSFGLFTLAALILGLAVWKFMLRDRSPHPSSFEAASPEIAFPVSRVPDESPDEIELIRNGDPTVDKRSRSAIEILALAEGRAARKHAHLAIIRREILSSANPDQKAAALATLRPFLTDSETVRAALGVLAMVPGPQGPDWLYQVWTESSEQSETTLLARDLMLSTDVRERASASLAATLDLRDAESCEQIRDALPHVWAHGDRRAITTLVRIARDYPCRFGPAEKCHRCLAGSVPLHHVIETVRRRPGPTLLHD